MSKFMTELKLEKNDLCIFFQVPLPAFHPSYHLISALSCSPFYTYNVLTYTFIYSHTCVYYSLYPMYYRLYPHIRNNIQLFFPEILWSHLVLFIPSNSLPIV